MDSYIHPLLIIPRELLLLIMSLLDIGSKFPLGITTKSFRKISNKIDRDTIILDIIDNGYTNLFKWTTKNTLAHNLKCANYYEQAAFTGRLDIMKHMYETDPNSMSVVSSLGHRDTNTLHSAITGNHIEIVKWLLDNEWPWWDETSCRIAAINGRFEILKWLHENGCPWNEFALSCAARNGHFEIVKWLHENGCHLSMFAYNTAGLISTDDIAKYSYNAENPLNDDHLEIIKYLHNNDCPFDFMACVYASATGHYDILKYLHKIVGCPLVTYAFEVAIMFDRFEIFKYLHENGCRWDTSIIGLAIRYNRLEMLKYLHENGCPCNTDWCTYCCPHLNKNSI